MEFYNKRYWTPRRQNWFAWRFLKSLPRFQKLTFKDFVGSDEGSYWRRNKWDAFMLQRMRNLRNNSNANQRIRDLLRTSLDSLGRHGADLREIAEGVVLSEKDPRPLGRYNVVFWSGNWLRGDVYRFEDTDLRLHSSVVSMADAKFAVFLGEAGIELSVYDIVKEMLNRQQLRVKTPGFQPPVRLAYSILDSTDKWLPLSLQQDKVAWVNLTLIDTVELPTGEFQKERCRTCRQYIEILRTVSVRGKLSLGLVTYGVSDLCLGAGWLVLYPEYVQHTVEQLRQMGWSEEQISSANIEQPS